MNSADVADLDQATPAQYNNLRKDLIIAGGDFATTTGSADAYVLAIDAAYTAYALGDFIRCKLSFTNAATNPTINVNTIGAKTIKDQNGNDLTVGALTSGDIVDLRYDGTNFRLVSPIKRRVATGSFTISASGSKAITGVGFKPRYVTFHHASTVTMASNTGAQHMTGHADGAGSEHVSVSMGASLAGGNVALMSAAACISAYYWTGSAVANAVTADFTSLDDDGFTLNVSVYASSITVYFTAYE